LRHLKNFFSLGKEGERRAAIFLKNLGYQILTRNYRSPFGEIDLIAKDKDTICFIEVKSRSSKRFGLPGEALTSTKQKHMSKAALCYLKENKFLNEKARFDVVTLAYNGAGPELELIKNAFELEARFIY
jgi:putative endonuclease